MKEYLYNEWRNGVSPKYLHFFDEWFDNLTDTQKIYFSSFAEGYKTPWRGQS